MEHTSDDFRFRACGLPGKFGDLFDSFLENSIGVPPASFNLIADSDWATIIKLHAFLESSLNHLLVSHFKDERLYPIIARLDVSDQTKGKLAYIKALGLLPKEYRSFIKQFSEIRNSLVHNAKNLNFSIISYFQALEDSKRRDLRNVIVTLHMDLISGMTREQMHEHIDKSLKVALILCVATIMKVVDLRCKANDSRS